jgi:hypothetical protein
MSKACRFSEVHLKLSSYSMEIVCWRAAIDNLNRKANTVRNSQTCLIFRMLSTCQFVEYSCFTSKSSPLGLWENPHFKLF